ncbi:response regulator transcription factor [Scardovia wiggsiae]|uniref:response regulator transcription factor n=1 Tax=Scardovia wiggsiae TaxID=230143 RepID=UPI00374F83EF
MTLKELQIVHFIADGLSNKVIAEKLFITYSSVRRDISKILRKLHMHSRAEIISNWYKANLDL